MCTLSFKNRRLQMAHPPLQSVSYSISIYLWKGLWRKMEERTAIYKNSPLFLYCLPFFCILPSIPTFFSLAFSSLSSNFLSFQQNAFGGTIWRYFLATWRWYKTRALGRLWVMNWPWLQVTLCSSWIVQNLLSLLLSD